MDNTNIAPIENEEFEHAKAAAEKAENLFTLKFKKPFSYDGVDYDELQFDFEGLTGNDSLEIEREMNRMGQQLAVPAFSGDFITRMCARACTVPIGRDAWKNLSMRDWHKLRAGARNFLFSSES